MKDLGRPRGRKPVDRRDVAYRETAQLAKAQIEQATEQQQITPDPDAARRSRRPMRAKPVAFLLSDLGVGSQCTSVVSR